MSLALLDGGLTPEPAQPAKAVKVPKSPVYTESMLNHKAWRDPVVDPIGGAIKLGQPVFLLRADDPFALELVREYAARCQDRERAALAEQCAREMQNYQP